MNNASGTVKLDKDGKKKPAHRVMEELVTECVGLFKAPLISDEQVISIRKGHKGNEAKALKLITAQVNQAFQKHMSDRTKWEWPGEEGDPVNGHVKLVEDIFLRIFRIGPIQRILERSDVEDIAINGPNEIFVRTAAGWERVEQKVFQSIIGDPEGLISIFNRSQGATNNPAATRREPIVDGHLSDGGHRLSLVVDPVAVHPPSAVIRKHSDRVFTPEDYLFKPVQTFSPKIYEIPVDYYFSKWTPDAMWTPSSFILLHMGIIANMNILVLGKTGVGKTAYISMLGNLIPEDRRIIIIEDTQELKIRTQNGLPNNCVYYTNAVISKEEGKIISFSDLVKLSLRQRPDHLVVGETRGAEFADMIEGISTGHDGNITSIHAARIAEISDRVSYMLRKANPNEPIDIRYTNNLISTSFHMAVHPMLHLRQGRRYVAQISEFTGRLPEDARPDIANHTNMFGGGSDHGYKLDLLVKESHHEARFNEYGLTFKTVVDAYAREQEIIKEQGWEHAAI